MLKANNNYLKLNNNYLFAKIASEKKKYLEKCNLPLIDLSIGDVTLPIVDSAKEGIDKASLLLYNIDTFEGYPPSSGHDFLKEKIISYDYTPRSVNISKEEIFISDSSKSDISNILDIFPSDLNVAIQNPVYPVYVDSNIIRGNNILYYSTINELIYNIENNEEFLIDIVYICSPNNPTGEVITKENLEKIICLAQKYEFIIFFDAAYEAFIQDKDIPHSIYEIKDAKKVAIEFKSYSKTAGFTPIRLSYTVVPKDIILENNVLANSLFKRLKDTKYNGPSFLSEYAMYNIYENDEFKELEKNINYYLENTKILFDFFRSKGLISKNSSSVNSPYVWIKTLNNMSSWDFFYYLLEKFMILGTPGSGFGENGENYFRFTGFGKREDILNAINRLKNEL